MPYRETASGSVDLGAHRGVMRIQQMAAPTAGAAAWATGPNTALADDAAPA